MAFSKVTLNGTTLMDVTQKTVTSSTMVNGATALQNDGTDITGSIVAWLIPGENVLDLSAFNNSSYTTNGITYAWDGSGNCTVTGTASPSASLRILYNQQAAFPSGLGARDYFYVDFSGSEIFLEVYEYDGSTAVLLAQTYKPIALQLSSSATGMLIRLRVVTNHGPGSTGEIVSPRIKPFTMSQL